MAGSAPIYTPIHDWSPEARARIAEEHGDEIRLLLETAFSAFEDDYPLSAFGFDSVEDAANFVFERFARGHLDEKKIRPASRSFRLFTEVRFWLAQKTGPGYRPIMARLRHMRESDTYAPDEHAGAPVGDDDGLDELRVRTIDRWSSTLRALMKCTCRDIASYWLAGTYRLRRDLLGWPVIGPEPLQAGSKTARSKHVHDALLRFQCIHRRFVPAAPPRDELQVAVEVSLFSPCDNHPPYRAGAETVSMLLPEPQGLRAINRLWRDGLARLLRRLLDILDALTDEDDPFEAALARRSVGPTTLHAYKLDDAVIARRIVRLEADSAKERS